MLIVASHRNVPPNWAETAGPNNHSPGPDRRACQKNSGADQGRQSFPRELRRRLESSDFPIRQVARGDGVTANGLGRRRGDSRSLSGRVAAARTGASSGAGCVVGIICGRCPLESRQRALATLGRARASGRGILRCSLGGGSGRVDAVNIEIQHLRSGFHFSLQCRLRVEFASHPSAAGIVPGLVFRPDFDRQPRPWCP